MLTNGFTKLTVHAWDNGNGEDKFSLSNNNLEQSLVPAPNNEGSFNRVNSITVQVGRWAGGTLVD